MKLGKKYQAVKQLVEADKLYTIEEAAELVKKTSTVKFDATIDISFNLNVNTKSADQQVRGTLVLPHGNGKTKRVLAITDKVEEAKAAGADFAGGKELLEKIQHENWFDFDIIVATPNMMGELGKMGRLLGPKGLMPNPKTGTVSPDIGKAITEIKAGKVEYRCDKEGNMHISIARVSFETAKIVDNLNAVCETIVRVRPAAVKGIFIKNAVIHTTMGPALKITFAGR
ncbi:MAG: 50S ribosomal protein L1 [Erysipelotrichia bacterium]|jgi:large subunit ribosomal protein L1|nr:50S ribosomal protein L1 [Bacilli bacterium]NLB49793.1 50S ribosomal protein L1 [Erysipelotrichia bacterium]